MIIKSSNLHYWAVGSHVYTTFKHTCVPCSIYCVQYPSSCGCVGCVWGLCEAWYAMAQKTAAAVMFLCTVCRRVEPVGVLTNEVTDFYILLGLGSWGGVQEAGQNFFVEEVICC